MASLPDKGCYLIGWLDTEVGIEQGLAEDGFVNFPV